MNPIKFILAFSVIALQFQLTHASTSLDIEVYGLHKDVTRQIESGDTLFSGDSFQVSIKSSIKQNVFVLLKDSNGDVSLLKSENTQPFSIKKNGTFNYPGRDHWYRLDDSTGTERLYFFSGKSNSCTNEVITKITKENLASILKGKLCTSQELTFNHILQDLSLLSSKNTRGLNNISNQESENILRKYSSITKTYNQNVDYIAIPEKIDYQSLSTTPPTLRGIKEVHLFKEISPSVVLIVTKNGSGSGSLINTKGEIITNWHVVGDNKVVGVLFKPSTRRSVKKGDVVIADVLKVDEITDLALIKVRKLPNNIKAIRFGNSNQLNEGEDVHAIGHPQGQHWSYTKGVISSLRTNYEWKYDNKNTHRAKLVIQTQTPINPGNSGGPLLSISGHLLGVNSFKLDGEGMNYAVSIGDVQTFLKRKNNRKYKNKKTLEEKLSEKIGFKVLSAGMIDVDKDGIKDYQVNLDVNNNGVRDAWIVTNGKTKKTYFIIDKNENNRPEKIRYDSNNNGKIDTVLIDKDEDGTFDVIARDKDEDGTFESFTPIS